MEKQYVLYNPHAGNGRGEENAHALENIVVDTQLVFCDMTKIESYSEFFASLSDGESIIICGGDGTLNRFVNDTKDVELPSPIYYFPAGSGNDFANDLGKKTTDKPFPIDQYLKDLPTVYVNGMERLFINGIGYGLDGYCCEVGDKIRQTSKKPVNYTAIAIKALLFTYKRSTATVTVDGVTKKYKGAWIASSMNGRFYGGGMMLAPEQDRLNGERTLSFATLYRAGKLKTLMIFPSIFKGEHVKNKKYFETVKGHDITVSFEHPTALQIDGETVIGVTEYRVLSSKLAREKISEKV